MYFIVGAMVRPDLSFMLVWVTNYPTTAFQKFLIDNGTFHDDGQEKSGVHDEEFVHLRLY